MRNWEEFYIRVEFLVYFNGFVDSGLFTGNPLQVVGTEAQIRALEEVLQHTIFGPDAATYDAWVDEGVMPAEIGAMYKALRPIYDIPGPNGPFQLSDYIQGIVFDEMGVAKVPVKGEGGEEGSILVYSNQVSNR